MLRRRLLLPLIAAAVVAAGCGQKGPLYLPGRSKDTPWPSPNPPKAAAPDPAAEPGAKPSESEPHEQAPNPPSPEQRP